MNIIKNKESGYTLLIYIVLISLLSAIAFGLIGNSLSFTSKNKSQQKLIKSLNLIKDRLIIFSFLTPYLYISSSDEASGFKAIEQVPGIGYFPCPDYNGDGESETTCGNPSTPFKNNGVTLSNSSVSPIHNIGYVPQFVKSKLFQISPDHLVTPLYLVDTKFLVNNECFNNFFPINIYMDARSYSNAKNKSLDSSVTPTPLCSGLNSIVDSESSGISLNLNYLKQVDSDPDNINQKIANDFLINKKLTFKTLTACDVSNCIDDNGNMNTFISPDKSFFDPALLPKIKINGKPFFVFALISPGLNRVFESTITKGSYKLGGALQEDNTINIVKGGDDIIIGLSFLEWAKYMQQKVCSDRAYYSDIAYDYYQTSDYAQLNKLWLFRYDNNSVNDDYTNKNGSNWFDQVYPELNSNDSKIPTFSICELNIIDN